MGRSVRALLRTDIILDRFERRATAAGDEIGGRPQRPSQPLELRKIAPQPSRCRGLHGIDEVRKRLCRRQGDQHMHVIGLGAELFEQAAAALAPFSYRRLGRCNHRAGEDIAPALYDQNQMVVEAENTIVRAGIVLKCHGGANIVFAS